MRDAEDLIFEESYYVFLSQDTIDEINDQF